MGGSTTISNSETRAEALKLQSSSYGVAKTLLHGTARLPLNLLDFGDFTAIATTETVESGGKGGGGITQENTSYTYTASAVLAVCRGPIKDTGSLWRGKEKWPAHMGPVAASLQLFSGTLDQPIWSVLNTMHGGTHAQNYSGMALLCLQDYSLGGSASIENLNIEVFGPGSLDNAALVPDANGAKISADWLCSATLGIGQSSGLLGDLTRYRDYCYAAGLLLTTALTEQAPTADRFKQLGRLTNSTLLLVDGKVNLVPLGTEPLSRTYPSSPGPTTTYTYTPDNTAMFDLTPDQLLDRGDKPLVSIRRKSPADACNIVEVEFTDRANDYAVGRASVKDQTSIDLYGAKPAESIKANWIMDHETASRLGWIELQYNLQVLNEYEFELPWNFAALLPMNIVTLTDPDWELEQQPVRITRIKETVNGFELTAEDFVGEVASEPVYSLPGVDSFRQDYAADPGNTVIATVFEAPFEMTQTGLEVWLAVNGTAAGWGGCHVWVSADGVEYRKAYTQWGKTRSGALNGVTDSVMISFGVDGMTGPLLSGSALDASIGATLCYVGGTNPEYLAYETASLVGAGAYTLGGVVRGVNGSTAKAHLDNTVFVRCDDGVAKSGPLGLNMIGRQIYIKCQSFNVFGLNEQDLSAITATAYTITGRFATPAEDRVNLCTEGNFDVLSLGQRPYTWDSGTVVAVSGQPFTRALRVTDAATHESIVKIQALPDTRFHVTGLLNNAESAVPAYIGLTFYDKDGTDLGFIEAGVEVSEAVSWSARSGVVSAPANSSYAAVTIKRGTSGGSGHTEAAAIVVRRQSQTAEIQAHAATDVYQTSVSTFTVTATAREGFPWGGLEEVASIAVTLDDDYIAVVTSTAYGNLTNGSAAIVQTYGSFIECQITGSSDYTTWIPGGLQTQPGTGQKASGTIAIAGYIQLYKGANLIALRSYKLTNGDTAVMSRIMLRVELVKL